MKKYGLDAVCEFSPCGMKVSHTQIQEWTNPDFAGTFYDIRKFIETKKYEYNADYPCIKECFLHGIIRQEIVVRQKFFME